MTSILKADCRATLTAQSIVDKGYIVWDVDVTLWDCIDYRLVQTFEVAENGIIFDAEVWCWKQVEKSCI